MGHYYSNFATTQDIYFPRHQGGYALSDTPGKQYRYDWTHSRAGSGAATRRLAVHWLSGNFTSGYSVIASEAAPDFTTIPGASPPETYTFTAPSGTTAQRIYGSDIGPWQMRSICITELG